MFNLHFSSCSKVMTSETLTKAQKNYIHSLGLLDDDETIKQFCRGYKFKVVGGFYTDKRIASYWMDDYNAKKNRKEYAYYSDILSIDTVYKVGFTYAPYMVINRSDSTFLKYMPISLTKN